MTTATASSSRDDSTCSILTDARPHLADSTAKRRYNRLLFRVVAPRYRQACRVLSFGRDRSWKESLVRALPGMSAPRILDIASGTGDLAALLLRRYPDAMIVSADQSPDMLGKAEPGIVSASAITQSLQDMGAIPLKSSSVDLVTGGYALRNAPSVATVLKEVARVLKPGGYAAFLDFSRFDAALPGQVQYSLLTIWGSFWGVMLHGDRRVYAYIAESLRAFPARTILHGMLHEHGLRIEHSHRFLLGFLECIICRFA